jgi:class 3 adenylate cyclase
VHGDAVNLAARVEQMNKKFGTYLLVAETTASLCDDEIAFTAVGVSEVRGRDQPVQFLSACRQTICSCIVCILYVHVHTVQVFCST